MKKGVRYLVFISLLAILQDKGFCQKILDPEYRPPNVRFDNFLVKGGEASQESTCIFIDSRGFIWTGTETGLYRFDGIKYVGYGVNRGNHNGFTGFTVLDIFEDTEGTIWIGTSEALNKLDQKTGEFTPYIPDSTRKDGITNFVRSIKEDRDGLLWILTRRDIFSFDRKEGKFTGYAVDSLSWYPENSFMSHDEQSFAEDSSGNKWIVTWKGLYLINNLKGTIRMVLPDADSEGLKDITKVRCVTSDANGNIWIGTEGGGLLQWNDLLSKPEKINITPEGENKGYLRDVVTILEDNNGSIWIFGNGAFSNYNPENKQVKNYILLYRHRTVYEAPGSPVWINSAFRYNDGIIWFLNKVAGLMFRFDPLTEKLSLYRTPAFMVYQCIMEKTGSFWFACIRNNIYRMVTDQIPYLVIPVINSTHVAQVHNTNILEDNQKRIWFLFNYGTSSVKEFDVNSSVVFDQFRFPEGDTTTGRGFYDNKGNLWFVMKRGKIIRYNPDSNSFEELTPSYPSDSGSDKIPFIREDKAGDIWIAHPRYGLYRAEGGDKKPVHVLDFYNASSESGYLLLMDFLIDSRGDFWILTGESFQRIKMPEMKITDYTGYGNNVFSAFGSNIRLAEDNNGNIWVLNNRSGLFIFNGKDDSFTKIDITDEGPESQYYDLLTDRIGRIWIVHNRGISIFDPLTKESRLIKMPKLQFDVQSCQISTGQILFLNHNQLYVFNEDVPVNKYIPPVYLTGLFINGMEQNRILKNIDEPGSVSKLDLPFQMNTLRFEFAALNYLNPEHNKYRYFMKGMDKDTILAGPGTGADYKNIPPGNYKFWFTGSNNDGIWNQSGAFLDIRIHPPWFRSVFAYIVYFLTLGFFIAGYVRLRTYRLRREKIRLKSRVEAATAELEAKNLQLAEIDRIKTHFFTDISHEIRTPLTLILGPLETISKEEMLSSRMTGMIDLMKSNANRLMNLVNQLLDISSLDAGKMKITLVQDDIVKCLKILVYEFLSLAESKHINYIADLPEKVFKTWFDRDKTEKIISNLLSNAFKYSSQNGTVQCIIKIETDKDINDRYYLDIRVMDSGKGISKENQDRIFDRFFRVEGHQENEGYGTGIGLSLVREFVSLLHGKLKLSSTPGKGSDFKITLPLGKEHLTPEEYIITGSSNDISGKSFRDLIDLKPDTGPVKPEVRKRIRILIIEDNKELREYIKDSLHDNYNILEADNGRSGINIAFTMIPDLIVTDILMPGLDGTELCTQLKNDDRTSHIPIIMLTAKSTSEDKLRGLLSGADDYIFKPFNISELITRISNLLSMRDKLKLKYDRFNILGTGNEIPETTDDRFMDRVINIINASLRDHTFDVRSLQEKIGMSKTHLTRKLEVLTGLSPGKMIRNIRLERAAELLKTRAGNITEVSNSVGISNPSNFTKAFKKHFGVSPKDYAP